jgi:hypothetical protein
VRFNQKLSKRLAKTSEHEVPHKYPKHISRCFIWVCGWTDRRDEINKKILPMLIKHVIKALLPVTYYEEYRIKEEEMSGGYDSYGGEGKCL